MSLVELDKPEVRSSKDVGCFRFTGCLKSDGNETEIPFLNGIAPFTIKQKCFEEIEWIKIISFIDFVIARLSPS